MGIFFKTNFRTKFLLYCLNEYFSFCTKIVLFFLHENFLYTKSFCSFYNNFLHQNFCFYHQNICFFVPIFKPNLDIGKKIDQKKYNSTKDIEGPILAEKCSRLKFLRHFPSTFFRPNVLGQKNIGRKCVLQNRRKILAGNTWTISVNFLKF